jgi:hypothetical protein
VQLREVPEQHDGWADVLLVRLAGNEVALAPPEQRPFVRSLSATRPVLAANANRWPRRLLRTPPLRDQT